MDEWQIDEYGRRYRKIGNIKDYEKMIRVDGGIEIPESQLAAYHENKSKAKELLQDEKKPLGRCPFSNGLNNDCSSDCALFTERGCRIVNKTLRVDTIGKKCPFSSYRCTSDCRLYNGGCSF